jgi:exopolyphosphatase/pppGpp-phosphohydrolase
MPAATTTLAAILEYFSGSRLTVARGGIREGAILTMADEVPNVSNSKG